MSKMIIKEEKKYTKSTLSRKLSEDENKYTVFTSSKKLSYDSENLDRILNTLLNSGIVKVVWCDKKKFFKFSFVGIIIIEDVVIYSYPKYFKEYDFKKFKQIIRVIKKVNRNKDVFSVENEVFSEDSFNILPVFLFLIKDYFDYGLYESTKEIIEINGNNEILWEKTISNFYPIIFRNKPYYPEVYTRKRVQDSDNYFRKLHKIILTECFKRLEKLDLLNLFDITKVILTDETIEGFNDIPVN